MKEKFAFLASIRFWKLIIIGVLGTLQLEGVIDGGLLENLTYLVEFVLGGSIAIRTIDRASEKSGTKNTK